MTSDDSHSDGQLSRNQTECDVDWEQVPLDPDLEADLGYAISEWEPITTASDDGQLVYLPAEEELLRQDAFIVVAREDEIELIDER